MNVDESTSKNPDKEQDRKKLFPRSIKTQDDTSDPLATKKKVGDYPYKRPKHPFLCRLKESSQFTVTSPLSLIGAGFASLGMGLYTIFRPTPFLICSLLLKLDRIFSIETKWIFILLVVWEGIIEFVLIFLGMLLTLSARIQKRWVLMLHPWGLILMYFDVIIWLGFALCLHFEMYYDKRLYETITKLMKAPLVFFVIVYIEIFFFFLLHYVYATFFIAAELTVIEKFF